MSHDHLLFVETVDVQNSHLFDDRGFARLAGAEQQKPLSCLVLASVLDQLLLDLLALLALLLFVIV